MGEYRRRSEAELADEIRRARADLVLSVQELEHTVRFAQIPICRNGSSRSLNATQRGR